MLVGIHALLPVRNIRTLLTAELLARAIAAKVIADRIDGWIMVAIVAAMIVVDLMMWRKMKEIYDPVTSELTRALNMS